MGLVYRAKDLVLGREMALKFLPGELSRDLQARHRLVNEARAASRLNHPNIAIVYEVGETEGAPYIAMELVSGETLKDALRRGAISASQLPELVRQIAEGLEDAHRSGILHRDIKPSNVMLDSRGRVKILDFGLAVVAGRERGPGEPEETFISRTATQATTGGTVPYMSPEQLRGDPTDARSDIFSFGVLVYECLAGRLPFRGETAIDIMQAILRQAPTPLRSVVPDISSDWERLVERCLAKRPEQRPQSMAEVLEALKRVAAPAARAEKSLAVLYFENISGSKEEEYFRDGVTEDIIVELSKIRELRVFPRSAVVVYRDKPATAPQIGRELNAAYVLGGSLRRAGNRLRLTAQLVEARTGHSVWAERYDRQMEDVFAIQDEIAQSIAHALQLMLTEKEKRAIEKVPTADVQAYDCYLRGRSFARRVTRRDLEFAMEMYQRAIALDPGFALAHAGFASVCGLYYDWHSREPGWIEKGLAACERALALEPQLAEGLAARARIFWAQSKYDEAIQYARMAIERKSDCEGAYWTLGQACFASDRWDEAAAVAERAVEASGDDYNVYVPYSMVFERLGQPEASRRLKERQIEMLKRQLELVPEDVRARILLANLYASFNNVEPAVREVERAVALRPDDANILYNAACTYGLLQKKTEALAMLKRAKAAGFPSLDWAARDPDLNCLHDDPEFKRLIQRPAQS